MFHLLQEESVHLDVDGIEPVWLASSSGLTNHTATPVRPSERQESRSSRLASVGWDSLTATFIRPGQAQVATFDY